MHGEKLSIKSITITTEEIIKWTLIPPLYKVIQSNGGYGKV